MMEETQQGVPFQFPQMPVMQAPREQYPGTILQLTDAEKELYKFELKLKGMRLEQDGSEIVVGYPLLNELGVHRIMMLIDQYVNKHHNLTFYREKDVQRIIMRFNDALCQLFLEYTHRFEIKTDSDKKDVQASAIALVEATLRRGLEGGERSFWKNSQHHVSVETNQQKEESGWKKLVPWK